MDIEWYKLDMCSEADLNKCFCEFYILTTEHATGLKLFQCVFLLSHFQAFAIQNCIVYLLYRTYGLYC